MSSKDIRVLLFEDDPYSRDLMTMLLTRDWRTRVVGEAGAGDELHQHFSLAGMVDVVVLDTEITQNPRLPQEVRSYAARLPTPPVILYTGTQPNEDLLRDGLDDHFGGYLLKTEILYSLATAVSLAAGGHPVVTPRILHFAQEREIPLPKGTLILDGTQPVQRFSRRESEIIRLGILFNLAQRDMADELVVSREWTSEIMSKIYEKLGIRDIVANEVSLDEYFEDPAIKERFQSILNRASKGSVAERVRKAPWISTLAFHLLTRPGVTVPED